MQILYKFLSISFILFFLLGCIGATPISDKTNIQENTLEQQPETEDLYTKESSNEQYYKSEANIKKDINVRDTETNQISWGGNDSIHNTTLYLKSLKEYVKNKHPHTYWDFSKRKKECEQHISSYEMPYRDVKTYCNNLVENGISSWSEHNRNYNFNNDDKGRADCRGCRKEKPKLEIIESYNFLTDKEKLSIFTNYLITKKYNLKKDKFEKTSAFQERVLYVKDNIKSITNKYMSIAYNTIYGEPIIKAMDYDADNELFYGVLKSSKGNLSEKIAVNVPLNVAKSFYNSYKEAEVIYQYKDGKVYLKNIIISYNNKNYMAVLNKMNYKPSDLKVALYQDIEYSEKLIAKLSNDIPQLLKKSKSTKTDNTKWLFIVGIEDYEYTDSVKYSANSAKEFKAVIKKRLGIPEKNIRTLINRGATGSKIDYKLKDILRRVKSGDTIYFYYSGHGIPAPSQNNAPYMLAQDMNPAYLTDERFKLQNIYKQLSGSKASKVVAFIDSCFSGGTDNQALIKGVAATRVKPKSVTFNKDKMLVISAGSGTQYSNKYDEKSNRLFSYYVMRGLINNNTDTQRLYDYVKSNVQEKSYEMGSSYEQVPVYDGNIRLKL